MAGTRISDGTPTSITGAEKVPIGTGSGKTTTTTQSIADLARVSTLQGLGTGVASALAINVGSAGSPIVNGGALGTPLSGNLTNCTFPTLNQNTTGSAAKWTTGRTLSITGDLAYTSPSFDGSGDVTAAGTLATVNSNVGSFGSATKTVTFTVNGKGLVTAASEQTVTPALASITGLGTNWPTALAAGLGTGWSTALAATYVTPASNNKQAWVGYIFQESAWTSLSNYTTNTPASTISISGGVLTLTGGANNFLNYIKRNYTTAATSFFIDANIKATADGNGIGLGMLATPNSLTVEMDCNTAGARGTVYITLGGTRVATSSSVMTYTNSTDILNFSLQRNNNNWVGTVYNTTTGTTVSVTYGQDLTVANGVAFKMANPYIYIKGGTFTVTGSNSFNYFIQQKKGAPLFCGDSLTEGAYAVAQNTSYVDILRQLCIDPIELMAAGGTTSSDWATTLYTEVLNFAPTVIYMMIGTNDATASVSQATYAANLSTLETNLAGYKIVYLYVPPHGSSATIEAFVAQYNTTLSGKTYHIDVHTPLYNSTTGLCASSYIASDNLHLNAAGNVIVAKTIQQSTTATTDLPFNSFDKQWALMTRGGSTFSLDRITSITAGDKLYLTGTARGINFNSTTDNAVIMNNFAGSFTMAAGSNYSMMVWPTMTAIANAQAVYGIAARDNRSLGAFTDGGWFGIVAQTSGGTDIARIGVNSGGSSVLEIGTAAFFNTAGAANASGSFANLVYASSGGKSFNIRNSTGAGNMSYVIGNDSDVQGAFICLVGSAGAVYSGSKSLNIDSRSSSTGIIGFWKNTSTQIAEMSTTFGGRLSLGSNSALYNFSITQAAQSSGVPKLEAIIGAAHTAMTAGTENIEILWDLSAAAGYSTGAITTLRTIRFLPRTYNFVGASAVTTAATLSLGGATIAGNNGTITTSIGLNIESASVIAGTGAVTTAYSAFFNAPTGATTNIALGLAAGTTTTAPLRLLSGTSLTTAVAGVFEFTTDDLFFTITTGAARKNVTLWNTLGTSGRVPFATTNGRLTDSSVFTFDGTRLSPQFITLAAGTTSNAPLVLTSGTNLTTAAAGSLEYNGTNLFFTRTGTTRENVLVAVDNAAAPTTTATPTFTSYYGGNTNALGDPNRWLSVNVLGSVYKIPLYN